MPITHGVYTALYRRIRGGGLHVRVYAVELQTLLVYQLHPPRIHPRTACRRTRLAEARPGDHHNGCRCGSL